MIKPAKESQTALRQEVEELVERPKEELAKSRGWVKRISVPAPRGIDFCLPSSTGEGYSLDYVTPQTPLSNASPAIRVADISILPEA